MKIHITDLFGGELLWKIDEQNPHKYDMLAHLEEWIMKGGMGDMLKDVDLTSTDNN